MGDDNPDFDPKVGDQVWYDYNDDWAEATIVKITGDTYTIDVDGVGRVEDVAKEDMLPVEFEEDGEEGDEEEAEEEEEEQPDVEDDLRDLLDGAGLGIVSFSLASAGIMTVADLSRANDSALKSAGITDSSQRKSLLKLAAPKPTASAAKQDIPPNCILVSFPAGPLGIDINMVDGHIIVTSSKGNALEQGVGVNDRLIRVGPTDLEPKLKNVPNEQRCAEVKKIVVSLPRPLTMVFLKEEATHQEEKKNKKRFSWFSKGGKDKKEEEEEDAAAGPVTIHATFEAGPLGLSVTNQPKRDYALCVTKAQGQAAENGVMIDDEIIALNDKPCRGVKSEEFKKLIQAAGRPFKLSVIREDQSGAAAPVVDKEAERQAKLEAEKRAIEEVKAKAKAEQEKKRADEKRKKEEAAAAKKQAEEEAAAAKKSEKSGGKKKKNKEEDLKNYKVDQEVWYDNGEDWVEATILEVGELLVIELRETGEEVADVERDWLAPMEYEGEEGEEEEEEEQQEEEDDAELAAKREAEEKIAAATKRAEEARAKAQAAKAKALAAKEAAEAKAKGSSSTKSSTKSKTTASSAKKSSSSGGFKGRQSHMSKFVADPVDKEIAVDHLHRGRAARMSYAAMITYASFHAAKKKEAEEEAKSSFKRKVRKARSKSLEKRGPQLHEGETEYQYLMRKKREEAYEEELRKEEAREEQARLREEKFFEQEEYRRKLEEEYAPRYSDEEDEYDD